MTSQPDALLFETPGSRAFLELTGLVDTGPDEDFDKFTRLTCSALGLPVALVSIVEEAHDRQYFKSQIGLTGQWATDRQTPLSHSFCQYVKLRNCPLIIDDAKTEPLVCENLAIRDLNVRAYLGMPIHAPGGVSLGALCAIDTQPRYWGQRDIDLLTDLAACVDDQIHLRTRISFGDRMI